MEQFLSNVMTKERYISVAIVIIGAIILVVISVILTVIAGLLPARMAAKKDPVEALRTE